MGQGSKEKYTSEQKKKARESSARRAVATKRGHQPANTSV